jgi:hypothetical protein
MLALTPEWMLGDGAKRISAVVDAARFRSAVHAIRWGKVPFHGDDVAKERAGLATCQNEIGGQ